MRSSTKYGDRLWVSNYKHRYHQPGYSARLAWFILIGWWLGLAVGALAYALCLTIIGIPVALLLLKKLSWCFTLRDCTGNKASAIWFILVGSWLTPLCAALAFGFAITVIGIPITFLIAGSMSEIATGG